MKKHVAAVRLVDRDEATEAVELPEELRLSLGAIAASRVRLLAMWTTVGLAVMGEMMTAEMTAKVGGQSTPSSRSAGRLAWERARVGRVGRPTRAGRAATGRTVAGDEIELAASLTNTNCIEWMMSIVGGTTRKVKRWGDGQLSKRWCAAGMRSVEPSLRRRKATGSCRGWSRRSPGHSKLCQRHGMVQGSPARTKRRHRPGSRRVAGRLDDLGPESGEEFA